MAYGDYVCEKKKDRKNTTKEIGCLFEEEFQRLPFDKNVCDGCLRVEYNTKVKERVLLVCRDVKKLRS